MILQAIGTDTLAQIGIDLLGAIIMGVGVYIGMIRAQVRHEVMIKNLAERQDSADKRITRLEDFHIVPVQHH